MNDRFKFRVWSEEDCGYMESNDIFRLTHSGKLVFNNDSLNREPECNPKRYTCEQCTGLKDKNGKLIYEGDILRSEEYPFKREEDGTYNYAAEVCFDECMAGFFYWVFRTNTRVVGRSEGNTGTLDEYSWEVIGNIHENKELLDEC